MVHSSILQFFFLNHGHDHLSCRKRRRVAAAAAAAENGGTSSEMHCIGCEFSELIQVQCCAAWRGAVRCGAVRCGAVRWMLWHCY